MSKAARQRRLKKEKERRQRRGARSGGQPGPRPARPSAAATADGFGFGLGPETDYAPSPRERAAIIVGEAIQAVCAGRQASYDSCLARLAEAESPGWTKAVSRCLTEALRMSVANAWRHGWQPAELARHVDRELSEAHASMLADMIADEARGHAAAAVDDRWAAQLAALAATAPHARTPTLDGGSRWRSDADYLTVWRAESGGRTSLGGLLGTIATAVEVLHQLQHLVVLEKLLPPPGTATSAGTASQAAGSRKTADRKTGSQAPDDRVLGRIRALLAKAESTEFAEEAEALSARAQELMAKYSIDHALLAARQGDEETPGGCRIPVDNPYESSKVQLLTEVARANRCRTVWLKELGLVTVIGFQADLDAVELLFTSLLVQANTAMMRAGAKRDAYGRSRTRAFRQSFLISYAYRIGERLSEAAEHAVREAADEQAAEHRAQPDSAPGTDLVPLLAARVRAVDDAVDGMFGDSLTATRAVRATDMEGWNSGRAAADMASLHNRDQVTD